jgi:hypothetical protein
MSELVQTEDAAKIYLQTEGCSRTCDSFSNVSKFMSFSSLQQARQNVVRSC